MYLTSCTPVFSFGREKFIYSNPSALALSCPKHSYETLVLTTLSSPLSSLSKSYQNLLVLCFNSLSLVEAYLIWETSLTLGWVFLEMLHFHMKE